MRDDPRIMKTPMGRPLTESDRWDSLPDVDFANEEELLKFRRIMEKKGLSELIKEY